MAANEDLDCIPDATRETGLVDCAQEAIEDVDCQAFDPARDTALAQCVYEATGLVRDLVDNPPCPQASCVDPEPLMVLVGGLLGALPDGFGGGTVVECYPGRVPVTGAICVHAYAGGFVDSWAYCDGQPSSGANCMTVSTGGGGESFQTGGSVSVSTTLGTGSCNWDANPLGWNGCGVPGWEESMEMAWGTSRCESSSATAFGTPFSAGTSTSGCVMSKP